MAQNIDYKAKAVELIPEDSFLPQADWGTIFYEESKTNDIERYGLKKQIAIGPDKQIYISDRNNYTITILDKTGKRLKTFGKKGYEDGEFINNQDFDGILKNEYLVISDNTGRINFFDLDGNFVKVIRIDFVPKNIFPLKSGNLIVWGHVPMTGKKSKDVLAELDFTSGRYTVFYEQIEHYDHPDYITTETKNGETIIMTAYSREKKTIRISSDDKVVVAHNQSGIIKIYPRIKGKYQESEFNLKIEPEQITEEVKNEYYENFKSRLKSYGSDTSSAELVKVEGFFPEHLPYFYNMILDDKNNALLFIYTNNENQDYAFQAYSLDGTFLGQSEFKIDGYDLLSNMNRFIFRDGYIYTLALKHDEDYPLRIIKCAVK
jgi:translation initiation factor IF-1